MKPLTYWLISFLVCAIAWHWSKAAIVEPKPAFHIEYSIADLNQDGTVNLLDLALFNKEWLKSKKQLTYTDANNPQGLPVYYVPDMPASEFERILK